MLWHILFQILTIFKEEINNGCVPLMANPHLTSNRCIRTMSFFVLSNNIFWYTSPGVINHLNRLQLDRIAAISQTIVSDGPDMNSQTLNLRRMQAISQQISDWIASGVFVKRVKKWMTFPCLISKPCVTNIFGKYLSNIKMIYIDHYNKPSKSWKTLSIVMINTFQQLTGM